jgi:hypothetical protein
MSVEGHGHHGGWSFDPDTGTIRCNCGGLAFEVAHPGSGGARMKLRLHGTPEECAETVKRLGRILDVVVVSQEYQDRGTSRLVRVYVEVRL